MRPIDADALIKKWENVQSKDISFAMAIIGAINDVKKAPTIDAVPVRHGRWLPKHHYIAGYDFVSGHICSECGDDALNAEGTDFLTDFCPHCGARMDEE